MLLLRKVRKSFGDQVAIPGLDLTISAGQTTVLIGPSGCGKSTILRLMIGLIWPDKGEVLFEGEKLKPESIRSLRHRIGYVIQEGGLFPHLTAEANVALLAKHLKWSKDRIEARITELAELTRLPRESLSRYPSQLSGGQRQRIGLIRALMLDPDLILLDEPMGALDPLIRSDLQSDLKEIFNTLEKTVVLVTHDLGEAAYLGDTLVLLRGGEIVQQGSIQELLHSPAEPFVKEFVQAQRNPFEPLEEIAEN
ncbi:L-proline glycine betaine ABC transport system permease protein ProV [Planctomycetales bacterium 10988]|nr:L-proline glycine betaine ABC transport system permease protein ProV [Planctomycetales bacterium 10988]